MKKLAGIPDRFIEKLKDTVDIVDLISNYVELKKTGKNYKGLCPFHQEKTPSFNVNPDRQFYYCFGCGAGGDAYKFLMEIENISFYESVKQLARRTGMELPQQSPHQKKIMAERDTLFEINYLTAKFYNYLLREDKVASKAVEYLQQRGLTRKDMEEFFLGYAPPGWRGLFNFLRSKNYSKDELLKAGLILSGKKNNYYDRFRDRIIFPIFNLRGEVLAFGGRILNKDSSSGPKYLNSPDTLIYKKGDNLYGFNWARDEIRKQESAIIMEGYTDVIRAHKAGICNVLASLGTALTFEQARLLKRYTDKVYIAYDADTAGAQATIRGLDILKNAGINVRVIKLPSGLDPDEFIQKEGKTGFQKLQQKAVGLVDFKIEQIVGDKDNFESEEKVSKTREIIELLADLEDSLERDVYLRKIADRFQLDYELVKKETDMLNSRDSKNKDKNYQNRYTKKDNETNYIPNINRVERSFLKLYIDYPDKRNLLKKFLDPIFFTGELKELIILLSDNFDISINELLNKIENEIHKKILLSISVSDPDIDKFDEVVDRFIRKIKGDIYSKLQVSPNLNLKEINKMLVKFIKFTA